MPRGRLRKKVSLGGKRLRMLALASLADRNGENRAQSSSGTFPSVVFQRNLDSVNVEIPQEHTSEVKTFFSIGKQLTGIFWYK